jgi:Tol biopolymer transport system component
MPLPSRYRRTVLPPGSRHHVRLSPYTSSTRASVRSSDSVLMLRLVAVLALVGVATAAWYVRAPTPPTFPLTPGSTIIAYVRTHDIYLIGADGSHPTQLTYLHTPTFWWPAWGWLPVLIKGNPTRDQHPRPALDGNGVVFMSDAGGRDALYRIQLDGSGVEKIHMPERLEGTMNLELSPDGHRIAYINANGALAIATIDDSQDHCLTCAQTLRVTRAVWSADGTSLLFEAVMGRQVDLYTIRRDSTQLQQITNTLNAFNGEAAWSPDGHRIAFRSNRNNEYGIYVMNADGSAPVRLTEGGNYPAWSPDSRRIAFTENGGSM